MLSVTRPPVPHGLGPAELVALARGRVTAAATGKLAAAESSKHRLLVEAVRRRAAGRSLGDRALVDAAVQLLSEVEAHSPDVVASLIELPQIGGWAVDCVRKMAGESDPVDPDPADEVTLRSDLGYLAGVAAAAALRTSHPFELAVPLRDGRLLLPSLGLADLGSSEPWGIASVRLDGNGAAASTHDCVVALPCGPDLESSCSNARWSPVPRLRAEVDGVVLDVLLDVFDPFLARIGEPASLRSLDRAAWQQQVGDAWQLLVRYHRVTAQAFAVAVSTLVPLKASTKSNPMSATSGWTFGAIGLSLPHDALSLAEMFVHEFHHLVLGAVEDLVPLVAGDRGVPFDYAPWRDDPRPTAGLLQGCYAHLGVTGFWRRQRRTGTPAERLRGAAEFARWRQVTCGVAARLARSPSLTEAGQSFATGICDQLVSWQDDAVSASACLLADDARIEHWVRWRLNNLRPAVAQIESLVQDWLSGTSVTPTRINVATALERVRPALGSDLARLLEARYRDPARIRWLIEVGEDTICPDEMAQSIDGADAALLRGDYGTAVRGYSRRLNAMDDMRAWAGLAVALRHSGPAAAASLLAERAEVVAAVHARLRTLHGAETRDVSRLIEWLTWRLIKADTWPSGGSSWS